MSELMYETRDAEGLDEAGNFYMRHVSAMTREGLHCKHAIAMELGHRDCRIAELEAALEIACKTCAELNYKYNFMNGGLLENPNETACEYKENFMEEARESVKTNRT